MNSFTGNGGSDDIFWYTPNSDDYNLWSSSISSPTVAFTQKTTTLPIMDMERWWRPLSLHWYPTPTDQNREVLFFGPGSISDKLFRNDGTGGFTSVSLSIGGYSKPLLGRFQAPLLNRSQIYWDKGVGSLLWTMNDSDVIVQHQVEYIDSDVPSEPMALVGAFGTGASARSEILFYGGTCWAYVARGLDIEGHFESHFFDLHAQINHCGVGIFPLLGDFDGDNRGDIFWYGPGAVQDTLLLLRGSLWDTVGHHDSMTFKSKTVTGLYKPLVGDFNGDTISDIFWYQQGTGSDHVWLFDDDGDHTSTTVTVNGDYAPIVGNFNNDICDDIVWFDAPFDRIQIWRSDCDGTFTSQTAQTTPANVYPVGYGIGSN